MYFEYNLPVDAPAYIDSGRRAAYTSMVTRVSERMELLEEALGISGLSGEVFSIAVSSVFKTEDDTPVIDTMAPEDIASLACSVADAMDIHAEPRVEWPNAITVVDTAFTTRKEWESLRMLGLGGSDAAVVLGISPYNSALELYHNKRGTVFPNPKAPDEGLQFIFDYGHTVEDLVVQEFCRRTGAVRVRETRMFRHKTYPYITANPDAILRFPDGRLSVLECKTTIGFNRDIWKGNSCPPQYVPQCNQYLCVLDDDRIKEAYIACICGNTLNDFYSAVLERDPEVEEAQIDAEREFWCDVILAENEPAGSDPAADYKILMEKLADADEASKKHPMDLPDEFKDDIERYMSAQERRKALEERVANMKEEENGIILPVLEFLGTNIVGELPTADGTYRVSWSPVKRTSVDTERLRLVYPAAYEDCQKEGSTYRTIRVSKKAKRK